MEVSLDCSSSSPSSSGCSFSFSASQPSPKSPPGYPDLFGKRRELLKLQLIEKEIRMLEQELKSLQRFQPASVCCKEIDDFIGAKTDPFLTINKGRQRSHFLKRLWGKLSCKLPCLCCCSCAWLQLNRPSSCACFTSADSKIACDCFKRTCQNCCIFSGVLACQNHGCCKMKPAICRWRNVKHCCSCVKTCLYC